MNKKSVTFIEKLSVVGEMTCKQIIRKQHGKLYLLCCTMSSEKTEVPFPTACPRQKLGRRIGLC